MNKTLADLLNDKAFERPKGSPTLTPKAVQELLPLVPGWELADDGLSIVLKRRCDGFSDAVTTLQQIADLANAQDHHPDVRIYGYRWLELTYTTHSIGGLSDNDFILAAKINQLLESKG